MIKFFFNRFSKAVLLMEIAGIALVSIGSILVFLKGAGTLFIVLLAIVSAEYAFIRYCTLRRWYASSPRWSGIELHFKKITVATSYILVLLGICILLVPPTIPLIVAAVLLAIIAHINVILLYLRRKDNFPTSANLFSRHCN